MGASGRWNRRLRCGLGGLAIAAALSLAGTGRADPLAFTGSFSILIGGFGVGLPGQGVAAVDPAGGHLQSLGVPEGAFQANGFVVTLTTPTAAPIGGIQITAHNGGGSFARPNGGVMPILGTARACLFGACSVALANLMVPLSVVGAGGVATATGPINVTVIGAPWTTGTAFVGSATAMGFARGPGGQSSSTALPSGELQLVTPIRIQTSQSGDFAELPAFGVLTLHFVPEPTTVALLGGGLVATALLGKRKRARD